MEIVKYKDKGLKYQNRNCFDSTCKSSRELEEIDLTDIIRKLK